MRIFTLLLISLLTSMTLSAQIFLVNSPESVSGSYDFGEPTDFGPSLLDSVWCGDLMMGDPNTGCVPLTNDLTGKIAVIDRGTCNFSLKVYHAQAAGAVGCIIVNNNPGFEIVGMLGGDSAAAIVIPSIFVTLEEGTAIKDVMANETVNACMGNIIFPNDVAATDADVTHVVSATVPKSQLEEAGSGIFTPIARIANNGTNEAPSVTTTVNIDFTPTGGAASQVYSETAMTGALASGDSVLHDILLPYDYSGSDVGSYTVTYNFASDSLDELPANNTYSFNFDVTENVFAEGPWDYENNRPARNIATTILDGGPIEMISSFEVPNGVGYRVDSVQFFVAVDAADQPTLEGIVVTANLYEWNDGAVDGSPDGTVLNEEVTLVATNTFEFGANAGSESWVTVPLLDNLTLDAGYVIPEDGRTYFVGTQYGGDLTVSFGFNSNYSFALANNLLLFDSDADFPYLQSTSQVGNAADFEGVGLFTDFFATTSTAMYISPTGVFTSNLSDAEAKVLLFPNPASEVITASITLDEQTATLVYTITDMQGRQIFSVEKSDVKEDTSEFNVEQLPAGIYNLNITTDKGIKTERFNVQR